LQELEIRRAIAGTLRNDTVVGK